MRGGILLHLSQGIELMTHSQTPIERKRRLQQELARHVRLLASHGGPDKVIVFSSLATGQVGVWSDIDLVIAERTDLPFWQRLRFFREEILAKGKIVYERSG